MAERSWKISDIWVTSHCHRTLAHPNKVKESWTHLTAGCEAPNRGLHQNAGAHTCGGQLGPGWAGVMTYLLPITRSGTHQAANPGSRSTQEVGVGLAAHRPGCCRESCTAACASRLTGASAPLHFRRAAALQAHSLSWVLRGLQEPPATLCFPQLVCGGESGHGYVNQRAFSFGCPVYEAKKHIIHIYILYTYSVYNAATTQTGWGSAIVRMSFGILSIFPHLKNVTHDVCFIYPLQ